MSKLFKAPAAWLLCLALVTGMAPAPAEPVSKPEPTSSEQAVNAEAKPMTLGELRRKYSETFKFSGPEVKQIALTFDDVPDPRFTPKVLDILKKHGVKATFFVVGSRAKKHPELLRRIHHEGHIIGNHSYSHTPQLTVSLKKNLEADFRRCNDIIKTLTGAEVRFFRPPFGVTNPRYAKVLKKLDLQSVGWSLRSFDTVIKDPQRLLRRITKKLENGSIVLLHDTQAINLQTLPGLIRFCEENGIKILPLNELIQ